MLYGTMNNGKDGKDGNFIRIFGHGTLSGDKLPHPNYAEPPIADDEYWTYHPIDIRGVNKIFPSLSYIFQQKYNI